MLNVDLLHIFILVKLTKKTYFFFLNGNNNFGEIFILEQEEDVLINICYDMISADSPSIDKTETTPLNILSVNFNSLFITGQYLHLIHHMHIDRRNRQS